MSNNEEFHVLQLAVESVMDTPLITSCRNRPNVNARMIFSRILIDKGHTTISIGKYLNRSHCTIVHYNKKFDGYIMSDKQLRNSYHRANDIYLGSFDPVYNMDKVQLKQEVFQLRKKIAELEEEVEKVKKKYAWKGSFGRIQEVLYTKVPIGQEDRVEQALNRYLNDLHY